MKITSNSLPLSSSFKSDPLFNKVWLRWRALTQSERVVSACIVLIPLWWLWGWSYLLLALAASILAYELIKKQELRLNQPSIVVIAMLLFGIYDILGTYFYGAFNNVSLSPRDVIGSFNSWLSPAFVIWYVQSHRIRVRPATVAWSFSVITALMLLFWAVVYFGLGQVDYSPPRSLFGLLTGKSPVYVPGLGNSNYLIPYRPADSSIAGFVRYFFFFHGPESLALVLIFICLLALDIKSKSWSLVLLSSSVFLLLLSGTRSAWIAFSLVFCLRWFLIASRLGGLSLVYGLIALVSFLTLCLPPITDFVLENVNQTAEAASEFRGDSTEVRGKIYRKTWNKIVHSSNSDFLFGHFVDGETVLPGYAPAKIGTHSHYLGSLLYKKGVIGTFLFTSYWIALISWMYTTRRGRPIACLLIFVIFSITLIVMAFESTIMPITLITSVTRHPKSSSKYMKVLKGTPLRALGMNKPESYQTIIKEIT